MRCILQSSLCAAMLLVGQARAETMSPEQVAKTILALQARVEALEQTTRRAQDDAAAARAELRSMKAGRAPRSIPAVTSPAPIISKVAPAIAPVVVPVTAPFDGFYVAAIGGYQFGSASQRESVFSFVFADIEAASGGSAGGAFGYNASAGPLLVGFEARARKKFGRSGGSTVDDSRPIGGSFSYYSERIGRDYGGDISLRAGMMHADSLLYLRLGGGADAVRNVFRSVSYDEFFGYANDMVDKTTVSPYIIVGLGLERNFGPMFARLEGAFINHYDNYRNDNQYYSTEVTGAIGYRF